MAQGMVYLARGWRVDAGEERSRVKRLAGTGVLAGWVYAWEREGWVG